MVNIVDYEDSDSDLEAESSIKNRTEGNEFSKLEPDKKENGDSIWQPLYSNNTNEASSSSTSWSSTKSRFVDMGYASALVEKAIRIHGTENEADILDYVLAYQAANYLSGSSDLDSSQRDSFPDPEGSECDDTYCFGKTQVNNQEHIASSQFSKEPQLGDSQADYIKAQLLEMGYSESEVSSAVEINGIDSPIVELVDFIDAHRRGVENYEFLEANQSFGNKVRMHSFSGDMLTPAITQENQDPHILIECLGFDEWCYQLIKDSRT